MANSPPSDTPPWKKPRPKSTKKTKMTEDQIAQARERANQAGRRYPNLIDNMAILKESKN